MLITLLKEKDEIMAHRGEKTVLVNCVGCKEVYFPEAEAAEVQKELLAGGTVSAVVTADYLCSPGHLELQLRKQKDNVSAADAIIVFSCGVGVQAIAEMFVQTPVYAACDTYPLPGHQGVTPLEYNCAQCGDCHLNETGGICPITSCAKSLVNGQCGGARNGKCEVDKDMECGWTLIYKRLEARGALSAARGSGGSGCKNAPRHTVKLRNFSLPK